MIIMIIILTPPPVLTCRSQGRGEQESGRGETSTGKVSLYGTQYEYEAFQSRCTI